MVGEKESVVYLMSGAAHVPYLMVSVKTLRNYYKGPIRIYSWPESFSFVSRAFSDRRLSDGVEVRFRKPVYNGRNGQFLDKIRLARELEELDLMIYLDADTTIHGSIEELFDVTRRKKFLATQFNQWTTNNSIIRKRLDEFLRGFGGEAEEVLRRKMKERAWPSVNGGVWGAVTGKGNRCLEIWERWTTVGMSQFIPDEKVLHFVVMSFEDVGIMTGGRWNCSPIRKFSEGIDDPVIYHYHGDSNVRPNKSPDGFERWWRLYQECREDNLGGVLDWEGKVGNRWLNQLLERDK